MPSIEDDYVFGFEGPGCYEYNFQVALAALSFAALLELTGRNPEGLTFVAFNLFVLAGLASLLYLVTPAYPKRAAYTRMARFREVLALGGIASFFFAIVFLLAPVYGSRGMYFAPAVSLGVLVFNFLLRRYGNAASVTEEDPASPAASARLANRAEE